MAATYNEKERNERINLVAEHILETGDSYRDTAKFFSEFKDFEISHVTVKDYCYRYIVSHGTKGKILKDIINGNKPKSIEDENIKERVLLLSRIYASSEFTIEEMAKNLEISPWTIYRDLTVRLPQIKTDEAQELKSLIDKKLETNSLNNLRNQNGRTY